MQKPIDIVNKYLINFLFNTIMKKNDKRLWEKQCRDALSSSHVERRIGKAAALPRCNVIVCVTIFSRQQRERKSGNGFECPLCPSNSWSRARSSICAFVYKFPSTTLLLLLRHCTRVAQYRRKLKRLPIFRITSITALL